MIPLPKTHYTVQKATIQFNYFDIIQERQGPLGELKFKSTSHSMKWLWKNLGFCILPLVKVVIGGGLRRFLARICTAPEAAAQPALHQLNQLFQNSAPRSRTVGTP